ncbi:MAG: hypothetical protein WCT10_03615 [Patescibacteria group bacterium]
MPFHKKTLPSSAGGQPPKKLPPEPAQTPAAVPSKDQPQVSPAELEKELHSIYDSTDQEQRDMTKLEQANPSMAKKLLLGLVIFFAFLAAVSWAGFFFFSPGDKKFSGEGVTVEIEGPGEIKSGQPISFRIAYRNQEHIALGTASLELRLPKEFSATRFDPASTEPTWKIGSIAPGKGGSITVEGVITAPLAKQLDLQAILTYRPADFNSEFQKVATRALIVTDSMIELGATGPAKIMPGDKIVIDFGFVNTADADLNKLRLRVSYPQNFIPETAEPAALDEKLTEWPIETLAPLVEQHVKITGSFAAEAKGDIEIPAEIGYLDANDAFQPQKKAAFTTQVLEGQLMVALILNGKTGDQAAAFGDQLHYSITYKNTGRVILEDVTLTAILETVPDLPAVVLWNNLRDKQQGLRDKNRITWTKKQITALGKIAPEDEGTINFDLPLLAAPLETAPDKDYRVTARVEADIKTIDGEEADRTIQTPPLAATLNSDVKLAAEARYFNTDGLPIGTGPLPPTVGQATTYRINWTIANTLHDLVDLKLSARLPANVVWTGSSNIDAGDLKFDAAAEKIIWTLNWLPTTIKNLRLSFDVALTPTEDQTGRTPTLIDALILEARDKTTGQPIILSQMPLTTMLDQDPLAAGKSKVQ